MNPDFFHIDDLRFNKFIGQEKIDLKVKELGAQVAKDYQGKVPILLGVLNGSFVFMADLIRAISTPKEIAFLRAKSYVGLKSTGDVMVEDIPINVEGRHVIIVEDIVDKGWTLDSVIKLVTEQEPKTIKVAAFLKKPKAYEFDHPVDYCCFEIPNDFVVGYGLDYNEHGRGLSSLYKLNQD